MDEDGHRDADGDDGDSGGDAVCWLHRLCPECGAVPVEEEPARCWRCGTPYLS